MFVSALFTALTAAAAVLLAVAGVAKLRTPAPAASMLVGLWPRLRPLSRARAVARGAGAVELCVGLAAHLRRRPDHRWRSASPRATSR